MKASEDKKNKAKVISASVQLAEASDSTVTESIILDCLDPINKTAANKTEKYINDKLYIDESWGVIQCCFYTFSISSLMLFVAYIVGVSFEYFIAIDGKLTSSQLSFFGYFVKAIAVISFVLIVKAYTRMSDKALGYSGFIFAFSLLLLFSLFGQFEKGFL